MEVVKYNLPKYIFNTQCIYNLNIMDEINGVIIK